MKVQVNRAVRIAGKVYAAGSVHDITDVKVLKHPHFRHYQKGGEITEFVPKPEPKVLPPATLGSASLAGKNPSAKDGRLPGLGGALKAAHVAKSSEVAPETEVGGDADEVADEIDEDGDEDFDSEFSDSVDGDDEESSDDEADEESADEAAAPKKKKKAKKKSKR